MSTRSHKNNLSLRDAMYDLAVNRLGCHDGETLPDSSEVAGYGMSARISGVSKRSYLAVLAVQARRQADKTEAASPVSLAEIERLDDYV